MVSTVFDIMKIINNIHQINYYDFSHHLMEVMNLIVKLDCPHCNKQECISFLTENGNIDAKDRNKLTSYLYDHIEFNDIFFAEELIDEILVVISNTQIKEMNLHKILLDTFVTADCCYQEI